MTVVVAFFNSSDDDEFISTESNESKDPLLTLQTVPFFCFVKIRLEMDRKGGTRNDSE